jgi:rhamnosyltransferase subunit B
MESQKQITLATIGSLGDLHPMLALGLELQKRGYGVRIASTEFYREKVMALGLGFSPLRPSFDLADPKLLDRVMHPVRGIEYLICSVLLPHLRDTVDDLLAATEESDLLISGEVVYAAPIVAEIRNMPWASVILGPMSFFSATDPPFIPTIPFSRQIRSAPPFVHRIIHRLAKASIRGWSLPIRTFRHTLGLKNSKDPLSEGKFSPFLNLALFSESFAGPQPDWAPATRQAGFVFYDRHDVGPLSQGGLNRFLKDGDPPVLFTLGSSAVMSPGAFYRESLEAARLLDRNVVFLTGPNRLPEPLPANVFQIPYAPYSEIMPRSACVIHHGGVGTTAQSLKAGIPQLIVPFAFDQPDNANRIDRLGVGRIVPKTEFSGKRAAREIRELLGNASYRDKAIGIARKIASEDGLSVACGWIERLLR